MPGRKAYPRRSGPARRKGYAPKSVIQRGPAKPFIAGWDATKANRYKPTELEPMGAGMNQFRGLGKARYLGVHRSLGSVGELKRPKRGYHGPDHPRTYGIKPGGGTFRPGQRRDRRGRFT